MKISKSIFFKIFILTGFILSAQFSFATDASQILLPPDGTSKEPPAHPNSFSILLSASATISDTELGVYFEGLVGDAIVTVYDEFNNVVCQELVNTNTVSELSIPVNNWISGEYMLTVSYGITTQRGNFQIE